MKKFAPEGILINSEKNKAYLASIDGLKMAMNQNITLEAYATLCDSKHNLKIDIKNVNAICPREEIAFGIKEGTTREIAVISRVGRPISFKITSIDEETFPPTVKVSRVLAQSEVKREYFDNLTAGDILKARVTHLETFGAFVDIGAGFISLVGIENISVSRINHPKDRFFIGQDIFVVVTEILDDKINLSHKELLGTWKENAEKLMINSTVTGIVRSIEPYGIFVELSPNLSGLAEYKEGLAISDCVSVHIKSINEEKMKIKLNIIGKLPHIDSNTFEYFITEGRIDEFLYSPKNCFSKIICRKF